MFEQLLQVNYEGGIQYPVQGRINLALNHSHFHPLVVEAADLVQQVYGAALSRENLLEIWQDEDYSFVTKYLATLWWGNKRRHANTAYSPDNINLLNGFADHLQDDLHQISASNHFNDAEDLLFLLFNNLEPGGIYFLEQIGSAYFSKIMQFYFASHTWVSNHTFLPIICDQWLCRAIFIEMTENGLVAQRDQIFRNPTSFRLHQRSCAQSYIAFINYFNERVGQLTANHPGLSSFEMEGRIFSDTGQNYITNYFAGIAN